MTALVVPLVATPAQDLSVTLGGQPVQLKVYAKTFGLYADIYVNNALVVGGVVARNAVRLVRSQYLGFVGDLYFFDTAGTSDPDFNEFGSRFVLIYDDEL
jgi:hypothetical protein